MKKVFSIALMLALVLTIVPLAAYAATTTGDYTYTLDGNNYIKLRDMATMANNTDKNFEVL